MSKEYPIEELLEETMKENKQLKEQLDRMVKFRENDIKKIARAIEYINNASYFDGSSMCANDLLEILGGDKE